MYCCDPSGAYYRLCDYFTGLQIFGGVGDSFSPVPFHDVFPDDVQQGAETFKVEFDPDEGKAEDVGSGTSSNMKEDEEEVRDVNSAVLHRD